MMRHVHNNKGFTLIELFIAIVLFAIGIVGAAKLQMAAVANNAFSMQVSEALNVVSDSIERMKNLPLTSSTFGLGVHNPTSSDVTSPEGRTFRPAWNVAAIGSTKARNVTVTVTWTEKGVLHSTALSFVKGPNQP